MNKSNLQVWNPYGTFLSENGYYSLSSVGRDGMVFRKGGEVTFISICHSETDDGIPIILFDLENTLHFKALHVERKITPEDKREITEFINACNSASSNVFKVKDSA